MSDAADPEADAGDPARDFPIAREEVPAILEALDIDPDGPTGRRALDLARRYDMSTAVAGRSPTGVAAGAVYLAAQLDRGRTLTRPETAEAAGLNPQTVTENWRILADEEGLLDDDSAAADDSDSGLIDRIRQRLIGDR